MEISIVNKEKVNKHNLKNNNKMKIFECFFEKFFDKFKLKSCCIRKPKKRI